MKPTEFIVETSQIAQEADTMHADHEVQMARSDCYSAAKYAIELHRMLKEISEQQGLDGWVSEKITLANDYLRTVHEYLMHEMAHGQEQAMMGFTAEAAEYAYGQLLAEDDYDDTRSYGPGSAASGQAQQGPGGTITKVDPSTGQKTISGADGTETQDASGTPISHSTPGIGGMQKTTYTGSAGKGPASGAQTTSYNVGDVSVTKDTNAAGKPTATTASYTAPGLKTATQTTQAALTEKNRNKKLKEMATGGGSSSGGIATSMGGPGYKPTSGVPKKVGNAHKPKKITVGKGVY